METEILLSTEMVLSRQLGVDRPVTEVLPTERAATTTSLSGPRHWLGVRDQVWQRSEPGSEADWNIFSYGPRLLRTNLCARFQQLQK